MHLIEKYFLNLWRWINAIPVNGPDIIYGEAIRVNLVLARTDPVALDYWASKHILLQARSRSLPLWTRGRWSPKDDRPLTHTWRN